ncbi:MAG: carbohydrate-binding protein [Cereibacter sphaeroides]|uniref:Carbohydrate-binding protein n=1 Tax=Cereibacter sphaeroides TaxID=1063 RepID=A0A2W5RZR2_CERSP|nr:MAG: carbohydrate-binding protein [Cereibacter sphaeroides]
MSHSAHPPVIRRSGVEHPQFSVVAASIMQGALAGLSSFLPEDPDFNLSAREADQRRLYLIALQAARDGKQITPAAEWLIDNHHVVTEAYRHLRRDLNPQFLRQLPSVVLGGRTMPRSLALAWEYVALSDSNLNGQTLAEYVEAAQAIRPLTIGELWSLPSFLRFVLLENMLRLSQRTAEARDDRDRANADADALMNTSPDAAQVMDRLISAGSLGNVPYAAQLIYRVHNGAIQTGDLSARLAAALEAAGTTTTAVLDNERARQTSGTVTAGNIIRALQWLDDYRWHDWFEETSRVEAVLRRDPEHALLVQETRNLVRTRLEALARRSGLDEISVTEKLVDWAEVKGQITSSVLLGPLSAEFEAEIGYRPPAGEALRRLLRRGGVFSLLVPILVIAILVMGLGHAVLPGTMAHWLKAVLLLLFFPAAYEMARGIVSWAATRLLPTSRLPAYSFKSGIPEHCQTLVVIPCLLTSEDVINDLAAQLEAHWLSNPDPALHFALLSDWTDADQESLPRDAELLNYARAAISRLAEKYAHTGACRFHLLHRARLWNPSEGVWMGWERKRGKLAELNALLRSRSETSFTERAPDLPRNIRYVVTLDSDTRMPRDTVRKLAGMMAHPVNHPVYDPARRRIVQGHGLIQPRVTPSLTVGRQASVFQRLFSRNRGLDHYVFAVSDLYQDLFDQGTYTGKGIYDVDAFLAAAETGITENSVLSHDLIEGAWLRTALASDIQFIEDFPLRFDVDLSRQHRWTRGDWQLLPYLVDQANSLDALARYRIADNMRRSLLPVCLLAAGLIGLLAMPMHAAIIWLMLLGGPIVIAQLMDWVTGLVPRQARISFWRHLEVTGNELLAELQTFGFRLMLLPQMAWSLGDATLRALYRTFISRRSMLEWTTADAAARKPQDLASVVRSMLGGLLLAAVITGLVAAFAPHNLPIAGILLLIWLAAPVVAWSTSLPLRSEEQLPLSAEEQQEWRTEARITWRYFEAHVNEGSNHLPPDNFQEDPAPKIATRTSPSNIGLYLLATVSAREFNWISLADALGRIELTLETLGRMERFRGHLYNWYATDTLAPLMPRYVSTVDSGNLAGHLVALAAALRDWARAPALNLLSDLHGVADVLAVLRRLHPDIRPERRHLHALHDRIGEQLEGQVRSVQAALSEPHLAAAHAQNHVRAARDLQDLLAVLSAEAPGANTDECAWWAARLVDACDNADVGPTPPPAELAALTLRMSHLAETARRFAFEMDFAFLYNREKRLLSIGYRVLEEELDNSFYDLLASEARLASLFAIGKGDVPTEHWGRLGRQMLTRGFDNALISWSGCMFEYLMAPLVMDERQGSVLHQSCLVAVDVQIHAGRARGLPWGVSESAYTARDAEMNYQYYAFGEPELALRRWHRDERVVAPYATFLAATLRPRAALRNLRKLARLGARGQFGFYDALDFTPSRLPEGTTVEIVHNFMAHHQGMCILAVANCLMQGIHRSRFHSDPVIESVSTLLQERLPREVATLSRQAPPVERMPEDAVEGGAVIELDDPARAPHVPAILSNGRQSLMIDASGAGRMRLGNAHITRWRPDPASDQYGEFLFLRDAETGHWWGATPAPAFDPAVSYRAELHDFKAEFRALSEGISCTTEIMQADELDARICRVTLHNTTELAREIEVISYAELALDDYAADLAHTAFSRMFVATSIDDGGARVRARRNPRKAGDPALHLVHLADGAGEVAGALTNRRLFIGPAGDIARSQALEDPSRFIETAQAEDFTLDPAISLRRRFRLRPGKEAKVTFWTVAAASAEELATAEAALALPDQLERQQRMAWTRSQMQLHQAGIEPHEAALFRRYAGMMLWPAPAMRPRFEDGLPGPQSLLWSMSISGDRPIFLLRVDDPADLRIVRQVVRMQEYFRMRGLETDLVILNEQRGTYASDLQGAINALCGSMHLLHARPSVFAVNASQVAPDSLLALLSAARVVVHAQNGTLAEQFDRLSALALNPGQSGPPLTPVLSARSTSPPEPNLRFWNGRGGFDDDGNYVIRLRHGERTPHPWINVIARSDFGFHISAEGAAYTWSVNSRDHQLSPWSNEPLSNPLGEGILLRDIANGAIHTPYAALGSQPDALYEATHGAGWSRFRTWSGNLRIEALHTLSPEGPERIIGLTVTNDGTEVSNLDLSQFLYPVLGGSREKTAQHLELDFLRDQGLIRCRNPYSIDYAGQILTLSTDAQVTGVCLSRLRWLGRNRTPDRPRWFDNAAGGRLELATDGDPLMMLETWLSLQPGESHEVTFRIGTAESSPPIPAAQAVAAQSADWQALFDHLQVETPDPAFDLMVNRWLPYQALACRIRARTAFFQASGAYGFRDQLQDTLAMLVYDPSLARAQLLNAAGRQFPEGDVQHWWLPGTGAGVRTTIADDVVWLGHSLARYVSFTGDAAIMDEQLPFLMGRALEPGEHDAFFVPETSAESASLYEHAARALDLAVARTGSNGLPLFLGGDWNDGMNRVGEEGRGESVWLGWFLAQTLQMMAPLARQRGETARADRWVAHHARLKKALDRQAWDGGWYLRGIYDDGTPLGSASSDECRIDSIAQSWSVISGIGALQKIQTALDAALSNLEDPDGQLIRLFTPAFRDTAKDPGYIRSYPPGVRENGGQYTHAAIWLVQAMAIAGRADDAWRLFSMINPINHTGTPEEVDRYRGEPYVVAADVYGEGARLGRAGWTWYTGSAGWLHRVAVEHILGLQIRDGHRVEIKPCMPSHWSGFTIQLNLQGKGRRFEIKRASDGKVIIKETSA